MTPVRKRLAQEPPHRGDSDLQALELACNAIQSVGERLAYEIGDHGLDRKTALDRIRERWPAIDGDRAWRALWLGFYSYWHDHGRFPEQEPPRPKRRQRKRASVRSPSRT